MSMALLQARHYFNESQHTVHTHYRTNFYLSTLTYTNPLISPPDVLNNFKSDLSTCIRLPACVFFFTLHSHFSNTKIPNTPVLTTFWLRWNLSPKLPLASSVKEGNDTKYKTGGLYMIYRVTELLKIHTKFSGVSVEVFVWKFWAMRDFWYFVLLSVKNGIPCGTFFHAFVSVQSSLSLCKSYKVHQFCTLCHFPVWLMKPKAALAKRFTLIRTWWGLVCWEF